jgi:hypothetical protein
MPDRVEDLIKEIAAKHGIAVGRDDPILILQTLNQRLLEDSAKAQRELLDRYQEEMEAISKRWGDEAKQKAERILNAALDASRQSMMTTMQEGARIVAAAAQKELDLSLAKINGAVTNAQRLVYANVIAAVITLAAAFVAVRALTP